MRIIQLTLADRDNYLSQIENQIQSKRNLLIAKRRELEKNARGNRFLQGIAKDYLNYQNYIIKQKQDQLKSMALLKQYIGDINASGSYTENDLMRAKKEQNKILKEMKGIKGDLDTIIKEQ